LQGSHSPDFNLRVTIPVEYRLVRKLGEGTFSEVLKAESVKTRQKVAIKCMKSHFDTIEKVRILLQLNAICRSKTSERSRRCSVCPPTTTLSS
jgi:serine/threonine protein kinase